MSLSPAEVKSIAHLARLAVDEAAIPGYAKNLSDILAFAEQMGQIDTQGVEPMAHPLEMTQRLRPDAVTETNQRELFQASAPATADGVYLVPRVIE
jgi:aspartyl-tRNA(Asn)/glutamyl-tRNA(Gln) amidotransferase subunit C